MWVVRRAMKNGLGTFPATNRNLLKPIRWPYLRDAETRSPINVHCLARAQPLKAEQTSVLTVMICLIG